MKCCALVEREMLESERAGSDSEVGNVNVSVGRLGLCLIMAARDGYCIGDATRMIRAIN